MLRYGNGPWYVTAEAITRLRNWQNKCIREIRKDHHEPNAPSLNHLGKLEKAQELKLTLPRWEKGGSSPKTSARACGVWCSVIKRGFFEVYL